MSILEKYKIDLLNLYNNSDDNLKEAYFIVITYYELLCVNKNIPNDIQQNIVIDLKNIFLNMSEDNLTQKYIELDVVAKKYSNYFLEYEDFPESCLKKYGFKSNNFDVCSLFCTLF